MLKYNEKVKIAVKEFDHMTHWVTLPLTGQVL